MPRSPRAGSEKLPLPKGIHRIAQSIQPFRQNVLLQRLVALYAVVWLVTAIRPFNRQDWILENLPVFVAVSALVATYRKFQFSNLSYILLTLFLMLHAVGAHFTYTEMPLGNWLRDVLQLSRNHYDRVVHFSFGLLIAYPLREGLAHVGGLRAEWSYIVTVHVVIAWSGFYEILEAIVARLVNPELGAAYNGIQGDVWDAQKDMGLALAGAILCMAVTAALQWKSSLLSGADRAPSQDRM